VYGLKEWSVYRLVVTTKGSVGVRMEEQAETSTPSSPDTEQSPVESTNRGRVPEAEWRDAEIILLSAIRGAPTALRAEV